MSRERAEYGFTLGDMTPIEPHQPGERFKHRKHNNGGRLGKTVLIKPPKIPQSDQTQKDPEDRDEYLNKLIKEMEILHGDTQSSRRYRRN